MEWTMDTHMSINRLNDCHLLNLGGGEIYRHGIITAPKWDSMNKYEQDSMNKKIVHLIPPYRMFLSFRLAKSGRKYW